MSIQELENQVSKLSPEDREKFSEWFMADILPVPILTALKSAGIARDEIQNRVNEGLVLSLFTDNKISSGKAARMLQISRAEFLKLLNVRGISYINYSQEELDDELGAVEALKLDIKS